LQKLAGSIRLLQCYEHKLRALIAEHGSNIFIRDNAGNLNERVQEPEMWGG
jgi:hypothetical protein